MEHSVCKWQGPAPEFPLPHRLVEKSNSKNALIGKETFRKKQRSVRTRIVIEVTKKTHTLLDAVWETLQNNGAVCVVIYLNTWVNTVRSFIQKNLFINATAYLSLSVLSNYVKRKGKCIYLSVSYYLDHQGHYYRSYK